MARLLPAHTSHFPSRTLHLMLPLPPTALSIYLFSSILLVPEPVSQTFSCLGKCLALSQCSWNKIEKNFSRAVPRILTKQEPCLSCKIPLQVSGVAAKALGCLVCFQVLSTETVGNILLFLQRKKLWVGWGGDRNRVNPPPTPTPEISIKSIKFVRRFVRTFLGKFMKGLNF